MSNLLKSRQQVINSQFLLSWQQRCCKSWKQADESHICHCYGNRQCNDVTTAEVTAALLTRLVKDGVEFQVLGKSDLSQLIRQGEQAAVLVSK